MKKWVKPDSSHQVNCHCQLSNLAFALILSVRIKFFAESIATI
jgi:hypothetical protein